MRNTQIVDRERERLFALEEQLNTQGVDASSELPAVRRVASSILHYQVSDSGDESARGRPHQGQRTAPARITCVFQNANGYRVMASFLLMGGF